MPVTSLHSVRTTEIKALKYITDTVKTEKGKYIVSFGCSTDPSEASKDFAAVRATGTGKHQILAKHIIQSFAPGEVTPEQALKIGTELAERLLKNEYQYVLSVHTDKNHIHCHMIVNNVNMVNGKTFTTLLDKGELKAWERIQNISDEICREYGVSVIENKSKNKGKSHYEWSMDNRNLSWKTKLRYALDDIITKSDSFEDFLKKCSENNIQAVYSPDKVINLKFRMEGQERFTRARTLGWYYEEPQIKKRIRFYKDYEIKKTGIIDSGSKYAGTHFADIHNMKLASEVINLMSEYGITNTEQLEETALSEHAFRAALVGELNDLQHRIDDYSERISKVKKYIKLKSVYDNYLAISGVNAKKQFSKKYEKELKSFSEVKAELIEIYKGKKIDGPDKLNRQRDELIALRKVKNTQYIESKKKTKDIDYCRKALEEYLKNERYIRKTYFIKSFIE
ncbi:MAG: relaxase/mobilization nuclease domain-containing protein [Oscillospiraceae bacterium]|nr:relaxase/mobilization nuclease domain-containing protein [Oscillospiraceae bacterium]